MRLKVAAGPVFDEGGGVSRHIGAIARHSSHEVVMVPSAAVKALIGQGSRGLRHAAYERVTGLRGLKGFDVLHSHAHPWFTRLCRSSRRRASGWMHTYHTLYFPEDYPSGTLEPWQADANAAALEVAGAADARVCVSRWMAEHLSSVHGIDAAYIPNGVDVAECARADGGRFTRRWRQEGFVLFVGSSAPLKNHPAFLDLAKRAPSLRFVMIGPGLDRRSLFSSEREPLPGNLDCLGRLDHMATLDAIAASRAVVCTSRREGLPTVLLEAMAIGRPVVAPDHSGCAEAIGSGRYGHMYAFGSGEDLADKTLSAVESAGTVGPARERVAEEYDWRRVAGRIDEVYASLYR